MCLIAWSIIAQADTLACLGKQAKGVVIEQKIVSTSCMLMLLVLSPQFQNFVAYWFGNNVANDLYELDAHTAP